MTDGRQLVPIARPLGLLKYGQLKSSPADE